MEEDFYGTIKFKNGEEIFAKVAASEEEDLTMLILHNRILITEIKGKRGIVGYKVEPWLKTSSEDMFIINMDNVLTLSESNDIEMIMMYQSFVKDYTSDKNNQASMSRKMGYLGTVNGTKEILEKIYKLDSNKNTNS